MVYVRTGLFGLNKKRLISYFNDCKDLQQLIANKTLTSPYDVLRYYNDWHENKK